MPSKGGSCVASLTRTGRKRKSFSVGSFLSLSCFFSLNSSFGGTRWEWCCAACCVYLCIHQINKKRICFVELVLAWGVECQAREKEGLPKIYLLYFIGQSPRCANKTPEWWEREKKMGSLSYSSVVMRRDDRICSGTRPKEVLNSCQSH